jgi:hypothetical protein
MRASRLQIPCQIFKLVRLVQNSQVPLITQAWVFELYLQLEALR